MVLDMSSKNGKFTEKEMFLEGTEVEVCSKEEGFIGSWYVATILKSPSAPPPKTSKSLRKTALVRYKTLLCDDDPQKLLEEEVDVSCIRPLPPAQPTTKLQSFEVYDVVDAYENDGWWKGVLTKIRDVTNETNDKCKMYTVVFENPPKIIDFEAEKLRFHQDWVHGSWRNPPKQRRMQGLKYSKNMEVEVKLNEENSDEVWYPAIVLHEIGFSSFLVEYGKSSIKDPVKVIVESFCMRLPPPKLVDYKYEFKEKVDVLYESAWRFGLITKILSKEKYTVCLIHGKHGKVEKKFSCSEIRPHMDFKNGKWVSDSKDNSCSQELVGHANNNRGSCKVAFQLKRSSAGEYNIAGITHCTNTEKNSKQQSNPSDNLPTFSPPSKNADTLDITYTQAQSRHAHNNAERLDAANQLEYSSAANGDNEERTSCTDSRENLIQQLTTYNAVTDHKKLKQNKERNEKDDGLENEMTVSAEGLETQVKSQMFPETYLPIQAVGQDQITVSLEELGIPAYSEVEGPLVISVMDTTSGYLEEEAIAPVAGAYCSASNDSHPQSLTYEGKNSGESADHPVLPFAKSSIVWEVVESLDAFQRIPQKPHFQHLAAEKELQREGLAIGKMVSFANMVDRTSRMKVDDDHKAFDACLETLTDLKMHGFCVEVVVDRISRLLSIKDRRRQHMDESKGIQEQIGECIPEKHRAQDDVDVDDKLLCELRAKRRKLEAKLKEVVEKEMGLKHKREFHISVKEKIDSKLTILQGKANAIEARISRDELDFERVASASW